MFNIRIIYDSRETFQSQSKAGFHNDHQSINNIMSIYNAIECKGYNCSLFGGVNELIRAYDNKESFSHNDLFLNLSDGMTQEYSRVQIPILCDLLGVKYSGGGPFTVALSTNKYYSVMAAQKIGVPVANSVLVLNNIFPDELSISKLKFPIIIKPNSKGSSIGISKENICHTKEELNNQLKKMMLDFNEIIVEEYVPGYDATCFIIGNEENILLNEVVLAKHEDVLYNRENVISIDDYALGKNTYISAKNILSSTTINTIKSYTQKITNQFEAYDFARLDYRVDINGMIKFLEINTIPGIRPENQVGTICKELGIKFEDFIEKIIKAFIDRAKD